MAKNELITKFTFDSADGEKKIDLTKKSLFALHTDLNNFGKNTVVGKSIANDFTEAGKAADSLKNKVTNSLKAPVDNSLKNALADIKRIQAENIAGEKAVTYSVQREAKLQADAKIREGKRAASEALRTLKTPDRTPNAQGLNPHIVSKTEPLISSQRRFNGAGVRSKRNADCRAAKRTDRRFLAGRRQRR